MLSKSLCAKENVGLLDRLHLETGDMGQNETKKQIKTNKTHTQFISETWRLKVQRFRELDARVSKWVRKGNWDSGDQDGTVMN